jgi:hypothetical protein
MGKPWHSRAGMYLHKATLNELLNTILILTQFSDGNDRSLWKRRMLFGSERKVDNVKEPCVFADFWGLHVHSHGLLYVE